MPLLNAFLPGTYLSRTFLVLPLDLYAQDGPFGDLQAAYGDQIDQVWDALSVVQREVNPSTAIAWGLDRWEVACSLLPDPTLTTDQRRTRIFSVLNSHYQRQPNRLRLFVQQAFYDADLPTVTVGPGDWLVYTLTTDGWPGDEAFLVTEAQLALKGTEGISHFVAAGDTLHGLTPHQIDLMHSVAVDTLTVRQLDGP